MTANHSNPPRRGKARRDLVALEQQRVRAARLFAAGVSQAEVARRLGVSASSANRWHQSWKRQGEGGLVRRPSPNISAPT